MLNLAWSAIEWLGKINIAHRDISDGNILLAREEPSKFKHPETRSITLSTPQPLRVSAETLKLVRRKSLQNDTVYGLLHDLDMASVVPPGHVESLSRLGSSFLLISIPQRRSSSDTAPVVRVTCCAYIR